MSPGGGLWHGADVMGMVPAAMAVAGPLDPSEGGRNATFH
ncbi:hypothetical protein GXY_14023 [Novacetimonas hansenii ATCC 23769]|uniref:Uncharacterized protein n=1 Tax=Novacetimonas hansenii ATCC 23769 TaxID=714995 RepID=D5QI24_NOVHA|nr:hypothetical protein GXY_14023 [Novacetimonas hansenii ATCC 23769]